MNLAYRIYLGARHAERRAFSAADLGLIERVLDDHFLGWTTTKALGSWRGQSEETLVITVTGKGLKSPAASAHACIESCAARLKERLGQESVMIEEGGACRFF